MMMALLETHMSTSYAINTNRIPFEVIEIDTTVTEDKVSSAALRTAYNLVQQPIPKEIDRRLFK